MQLRFGIILTATMIGFAFAIALAVSIFDFVKLREKAIQDKNYQVQQYETLAAYALETVEKAYNLFGDQIAERMKANSLVLLDLYDRNPSFEEWDWAYLKQRLSSDIYIINSDNVIIHSSFEDDIGLDFKECCPKFSQTLESRRISGEFYHDGIDIEQNTGKLKKYSYMATRDKKYLIQLGYDLDDDHIFQKFDFMSAIERFVHQSPSINEINVLNPGGFLLGRSPEDNGKIPEDRRRHFEHALHTGEMTEYRGLWNGEPAVYRYVQYVSSYDEGVTQRKVLEIVYNEKDLQAILAENKRQFMIQLGFIAAIALAISLALTRWVAKPLHLAFHDSLTGLRNRSALDELFRTTAEKKGKAALLMIDLDNFKSVNDQLGHDRGDELLKSVAQRLRSAVRKDDMVVRWGGDEFVVVLPSAGREEAERTARRLLATIEDLTEQKTESSPHGQTVSASIGIALYPDDGVDQETLIKKADTALYVSKEQGKNQYRFSS